MNVEALTVNNMTRDEAQARARLLRVNGYEIALDLTTGDTNFRSASTVTFSCATPGAASYIDLTADEVREIELNGVPLSPADHFDGNRVSLPGLAAQNTLRIVAECAYMNTGEGLHRFVDPVDKSVYLYSQFETFDAHRMYACFDQPDLKATFRLTVTAPADWQVVTNTAAASVSEPDAAGVRTHAFAVTQPMSTYITALIAGPYHGVFDTYTAADGTRIPLGIYCRSSLAEFLDADSLFEVTRQGFDFFHGLFDYPYPFGKYDQLFVPEFNAGAMENAGAVTFLEDYVFRSKVTDYAYERRAETVMHEMAHMWFGDLVTMRWWDDLWLNESFATYASVLCQSEATRWKNAWTTFANVEKTWAYRQDQLPSTHPIASDIVDIEAVKVNFDGITYAKGASVLKQLVAYVGRDAFFTAIRGYFKANAWGNTTLQDLLQELQQASGRDLAAWSAQWLETAGVNTLRPALELAEDGTFSAFAVLQEAPADHPTLRSHRVGVGLYDHVDGQLVRRRTVEIDVAGERTEVPELVGERRPDVVLVNDDDLAYAKIRLDERSLATIITDIGAFADSLPRALCWAAAWDMTRDAEMAATDYLTLVLSGISRETDIGVVTALLRQAQGALTYYTAEPNITAGWTRLADAAHAATYAAAPGSDLQLAWVRTLASAARSDRHLDLIAALLDGSETIEGLSVDTELRWTLLRRLVTSGRAGEREIEAELDRDSTAAGERHAYAARAAEPRAEAKAAAWALAVEGNELPNALQAAVIGGFAQPEQGELLRAYVEPYFACLVDVWKNRTHEIAGNIVEGLYPAALVEQATLDRTDAYLAETADVPPALRRLLLEGKDSIARALRGRIRDATGS
ncbi:MAG: aminopeptidase [Frankiales bacterium]|jgi:aminopeptidase N|nr:aminopeptidase [Frankiales bacterium]